MRIKRAKAARRTLQFFRRHGDVSPPYHVLLDGTFLVACLRQKLPLRERLTKLLQNEPYRLYTTQSALDELGSLGDKQGNNSNGNDNDKDRDEGDGGSLFERARQLGNNECDEVLDVAAPDGADANADDVAALGRVGADVLRTVSEEASATRFLVATQDETLADRLRRRPRILVPIVRLSRSVLILEAPSAACRRRAETMETRKLRDAGGTMTREEREWLDDVRKRERKERQQKRREEEEKRIETERRIAGPTAIVEEGRRKRRAKGPNPLSCKKRKATPSTNGNEGGKEKKKRRRKSKK